MTKNALVRLLGAAGVAFLLLGAVVLRLHAAAPPQTVADRVGGPPAQATVTETTETVGRSPTGTITATVTVTPSKTVSPTATPTPRPS